MSEIAIQWITDWHDCETCGSSYAEGAAVQIDGELALSLIPAAHCFDERTYSDRDVFTAILKHLGHTVTEMTRDE